MKKYKLHIVALPYYEVGGCLDEFYSEAEGREMTLLPEPTNKFDVLAIRAHDWQGRHTGYVSTCDLQKAWHMLKSGLCSLRGRIKKVDTEHKSVLFECCADTVGEEPELYSQREFLNWSYSGPLLEPTSEMLTLDYMTEEIGARLDESKRWTKQQKEDFAKLMERFLELSEYDLSSEMADYKLRLYLRLIASKGKLFRSLADELRLSVGRTGRDTHCGDVLNYWLKYMMASEVKRRFEMEEDKYNEVQVMRELAEFPQSLYETWLESREQFVLKVLYLHIPRKVLWQLVSGIAFIEALREEEAKCCEYEWTEDEFVDRLVEETKKYYRFDKPKADDVRRILINMGREDAASILGQWMEEIEKDVKPFLTVNVQGEMKVDGDVHQNITGSQVFNGNITDSEFNGGENERGKEK